MKQKSKSKSKVISVIPNERIIGNIYHIRGEKVMFDRDLAGLYGVTTKVLNQAVKRNMKRFPEDFMFQLNKEETDIFSKFHNENLEDISLRSQIVTLKQKTNLRSQIVTSNYGGRRYIPYVFTEQGVAMLSSVLKSDRAIEVNIQIMRTFTKMRKLLLTHKDLQIKIEKMEKENKENFKIIFKVLAKLMKAEPRRESKEKFGF